MNIKKLCIKNFRGIHTLEWIVPDEGLICFIGKGDSSKSSIIDAIKYLFHPHWNITINDSDFYNGIYTEKILIEASISSFPEDFLSLNKYGLYLRGWDGVKIFDEPDDELQNILTVRLEIGEDLEPNWTVYNNRLPDGVPLRTSDREKLNVSLIGSYSDRELSFSKGTPIGKTIESRNLNSLLVDVARSAKNSLGEYRDTKLKEFDDQAKQISEIAKELGIPLKNDYESNLDLKHLNIKSGGLALHDKNIPLRLLGLGSRRMILCGIQKLFLKNNHTTLIDEIETGLEPHRITRLLKHIQSDDRGNYIISTHSPVVIKELSANNINIVHNHGGSVEIINCAPKLIDVENIQGHIRSSAESFLSKKVIISEGATEIGFLRGLDDYWICEGLNSFSYYGVSVLDARGAKKIKNLAKAFNALNYNTAVLVDGDSPKNFSSDDSKELKALGVEMFMWEDSFSIEERILKDLPWDLVLESLGLAESLGKSKIWENVKSKNSNIELNKEYNLWTESDKLRIAICEASKSSEWFKSIYKSEQWVSIISKYLLRTDNHETDLLNKINKIRKWITNDN